MDRRDVQIAKIILLDRKKSLRRVEPVPIISIVGAWYPGEVSHWAGTSPGPPTGGNVAVSFDSNASTIDWRINAACRDTDPTLFFPVGTTGPAVDQIANAKEVCIGCLASADCLQFAIATNQDTGVWGGTTENERRGIRRRLRAKQV